MDKVEELEALRREWTVALKEEEVATKKRYLAEDAYAAAKAASVGVRIGTIVSVKSTRGYGSKRKKTVRHYRIYKIALSSYRLHGLTLCGVTIRKDGTDGEKHEIWENWEVEKVGEGENG